MIPAALGLVLAAAVLHAAWNLLAKRVGGRAVLVCQPWATSLRLCGLLAPWTTRNWVIAYHAFSSSVWPWA